MRRLPQITAAITGLLVVAIAVSFAILLPLSGKVADQAANGAASRDRSCSLVPAGERLYRDAYERGVISAGQLALFSRSAHEVCGK